MKVEEIHPYSKDADKGEEVEKMFDSISRRYDLMNTAMSLGQFKVWRNKALKTAIEQLPLKDSYNILDVATGTGDVAFRLHNLLPMAKITGIDLSEGMLRIARNKLVELKPEERELIVFGKGDSLSMPFHDGLFNMVSVAYGIRNFSNIGKGLKEINRVLSNDGVLCAIELSTPEGKITKKAYNFYAGKIIPWLGKIVTGDNRAYTYLPESIAACPQRDEMASLLFANGFTHVMWKTLSFGALTYYIAKKNNEAF